MQPIRFSELKDCFTVNPSKTRQGQRKAGLARVNEIRRRRKRHDAKERSTENGEMVAALRNDALRRLSVRHLRPLS